MSNRQKTQNDGAQMAVVRAFISDHGTALLNASRLLGGEPAYRRSRDLIEMVGESHRLTRRMRQRLVDLHALLTLKNVGDSDRVETACFAEIDPSDPLVEDICLLADMLYDVLIAVARDKPTTVADAEIRQAPTYQDAA